MEDISQRSVRVNPGNLVYERKFDVALRSSHSPRIRALMSDPSCILTEILLLRSHANQIGIDADAYPSLVVNQNYYPLILDTVLKARRTAPALNHERLLIILERSIVIQTKALNQNVQYEIQPKVARLIEDCVENIRRHHSITALMTMHEDMTRVIDKFPNTDAIMVRRDHQADDIEMLTKKCHARVSWIGLDLRWSRNNLICSFNNTTYLTSRSYALLIHNKISDLLSVLILAGSTPDRIFGRPCLPLTLSFVQEFTRLAIDNGSKFFKISKVLESLVIGETLKAIEGADNRGFLAQLIESLKEDIGWDYEESRLQGILKECSVPLMHEMACLSKILGHPFCDMKETALDMYVKTHEERYVNLPAVIEATRHAKKDFIEKYIDKNEEWPPVTFTEGTHASLVAAQEKRASPSQRSHVLKYGIVDLIEWDNVTIGQCEKFSRLENFIPYVKDRTVSLLRSRVVEKYLLDLKDDRKRDEWKETRALLAYLLLPYTATEHLSYLELYSNEEWEAMEDLLVIRLVPKEKEHKEKARCFGCKPIKERARTIVLGDNAAKFLHKYSDSDAMTLSELALSKKLYAFRNTNLAYKDYEQIVICLDASGWNSRLRNAAVSSIPAEILDPYFGVNMYKQFHETYDHMLVYLPDVDQVYTWSGQQGGVEGLDQYVWVLSYIQHLKTVLNRTGYPYRLLVKGDDARVVIMVPPVILERESLDAVRLRLVNDITQGAEEYGYLMKPEDCYGSRSYCTFSKNAFINNVEMPQGFRKCQKSYGANNAFLNTLDNYAASSFSNSHAASKAYPTPYPCYILALWWHLKALLSSPDYRVLNDAELTALTLLPNVLGGFPIIFMHNFYQRAESDLLTSYVALYLSCCRTDPDVGAVLRNAWDQKVLDPRENIEVLCQDPYSLPLYKPPTAQSILRSHLRTCISEMTENHQIKDLFRVRGSDFQEILMRGLSKCSVYNPRVMCGIYGASPEGIITELVTKFESGKSVMDAIILKKRRRKGSEVLREAMAADKEIHRFRVSVIKGRLAGRETIWKKSSACPFVIAQDMRERLWKRPIEGITQPPVFHVVHIGDLDWCFNLPQSGNNHFTCQWNPPDYTHGGSVFHVQPHQPYLGESTSKGLTHPEVSLTTNNMYALKIVGLLDLYKWTVPHDAVPEGHMSLCGLIAQMIRRYTGRDIEEFLPFSSQRPFGRTTQHHLRANQFRPSVVPNTLQNIYTWSSVDMLSHHRSADSNTHLLLNYNEIKCWLISVLAGSTWAGRTHFKSGTYWGVTRDCVCCLTPIEESVLCTYPVTLPPVEFQESFIEARSAIKEIIAEVEDFDPDLYYVPEEDETAMTPEQAGIAVCQYILATEWVDTHRTFDRQAAHVLTHRGLETTRMWSGARTTGVVDYGDLRRIPIEIIVSALLHPVVSHILKRFPGIPPVNLGVAISHIPSESFPWTMILDKLRQVHRMRELQNYMARQLHELAGPLDSYTTYAPKFAVQCLALWTRTRVENTYVYFFSNRADDELPRNMKHRVNAARLCSTHLIIKEVIRYAETEQDKRELAVEVCCLMARSWRYHDYVVLNRGVRGEPLQTDLPIIIVDELDVVDELIDLYTTDQEYFERWSRRYSSLPVREVYNLVEEFDADLLDLLALVDERVVTSCKRRVLHIQKCDILLCKKLIQAFRIQREEALLLDQAEEPLPAIRHRPDRAMFIMNIMTHDQRQDAITDVMRDEIQANLEIITTYNAPVLSMETSARPVGHCNISISRFLWVMYKLRIDHLGSGRYYACFADGYGGALSVMKYYLTRSKILYVTTPTTSGEHPAAQDLMVDGSTNEIDNHTFSIGRWDLSVISNYLSYERDHPHLVDLCTCDAEVILPTGQEVYHKIWYLVSVFFIRNCRPRSILIIKVYLEHYMTLLNIMALLRPYGIVYLMRSDASSWTGEVFLVFQAQRSNPNIEYDAQSRFYPPERIVNHFNEYLLRYIGRRRIYDEGNDRCDLNPRYQLEMMGIIRRLPCYGWTMLINAITIDTHQEMLRRRENKSV